MAIWICNTCGGKSALQDLVKHDEAKDKGAKVTYKKSCAKSPIFPHGSDKPKNK